MKRTTAAGIVTRTAICCGAALVLSLAPSGCLRGLTAARYGITYEIRVPTNAVLPALTAIDLVTNHSSCGGRAFNFSVMTNEGFAVYRTTTGIERERFRCVVVQAPETHAQVFVLDHPAWPQSAGWSQWRKPNYIETSDQAGWNVMEEVNLEYRTTTIPAGAAELRFKVEAIEEL